MLRNSHYFHSQMTQDYYISIHKEFVGPKSTQSGLSPIFLLSPLGNRVLEARCRMKTMCVCCLNCRFWDFIKPEPSF